MKIYVIVSKHLDGSTQNLAAYKDKQKAIEILNAIDKVIRLNKFSMEEIKLY